MKKALIISLVLACACSTSEPKPTPDANKQVAAQVSPEQAEKAWREAATPGERHKMLGTLVGDWKTEAKMWWDPKHPPEVTQGESHQTWIMDGRFVEQSYVGKMGRDQFAGKGTIGFDNVRGRYISSWIDTMGTGMMTTEGQIDPSGKVITLNGEYVDPITKLSKQVRTVTTIESSDRHRFEMFEKSDAGDEIKSLEVIYTRENPKKGGKKTQVTTASPKKKVS